MCAVLGSKQKMNTVNSIVSNQQNNKKEHYLKGINYYEREFAHESFMNMWCGIMVAVLYLDK